MKMIPTLARLLLIALVAASCSDDRTDSTDAAPFDAVLIELFGTIDTEAYLASSERAAAELVVTCMGQAGFEFQIPAQIAAYEPPDATSLQAVQTEGFGIIAGFRYQLRQIDLSVQQGTDPNVTYLASLSGVEIERFFLTLDGAPAEPGQRQQGGCNGQASDQAYADWLRFFDALPNFTAIAEERDTHPDWLDARAQWKTCMIGRGFNYSEPDAIRTDVIRRMRQTVNDVYPGGEVPLIEVDGIAAVDPAVDALLDELLQFERQAAVANFECTEPVAAEFEAVERLVQQAFIDRNQATIDELLQAAK